MGERTVRQRAKERNNKEVIRWQKAYEKQRDLHSRIRMEASDILSSSNFRSTKKHIQHGNMTVNNHCMNVAKYSLAISRKLRIHCSERELIRGALLHDYFLYDWHSPEHVPIYKLHGLFHPGKAYRNASKEYLLTAREADIIKKHMWPLTVVPPMCREAWIVTAADKWCSMLETLHIHKGHGAVINDREKDAV